MRLLASIGMLLRRSDFLGEANWRQALELGREHRGNDADGYRAEFIRLVELAAALDPKNAITEPDGRR